MDEPAQSHNPHDHLARKVFGRREEAAGFFQAYLPEGLGKRIKAEKLHREPVTFIDESLEGTVADLLYRLEDADGELYLYCLFEHQSQPDKWMPFRLLGYMLRIWSDFRDKHPGASQLPPILPAVLHQGKQGWTTARSFAELVAIPADMPNDFQPFIPDFSFTLVDLAGIPFDQVKGTLLGKLAMMAQKATSEDRVEEFWDTAGDFIKELAKAKTTTGLLQIVIRYLCFTKTSFDKEAMLDKVKKIGSPELEEYVMTIAQECIEQGIGQGIEQGLEQGREEKEREIVLRMNASGMEVDGIVELTGIAKPDVLRHLAAQS